MSTVAHLPDSFERQWRVYESALRAHFAAAGASPEELDYAAASLKPIYLASVRYPFTPADGISGDVLMRELNAWVKQQVFALMTEVVLRDVQLHRLKQQGHST